MHWPTPMRISRLICLPTLCRPVPPPIPDWYPSPPHAVRGWWAIVIRHWWVLVVLWHLGLYALLGAWGVHAVCIRYARLMLRCSPIPVSLCPLMRVRCVLVQVGAQVPCPCRVRVDWFRNISPKPLVLLIERVRVRSI